MDANRGSRYKKVLLAALIIILVISTVILLYVYYHADKENNDDDWIPVNLALDIALTEQEAQINAEITIAPKSATMININTADAFELELLPGIGPSKARAIVAHRQKNGQFESIEALLEVNGIGPVTYENLKDYISID